MSRILVLLKLQIFRCFLAYRELINITLRSDISKLLNQIPWVIAGHRDQVTPKPRKGGFKSKRSEFVLIILDKLVGDPPPGILDIDPFHFCQYFNRIYQSGCLILTRK